MKKLYLFVVIFLLHITSGLVVAQQVAIPQEWEGTPQAMFLTSDIVQGFQCTSCHTITERGGTVGPILNHIGNRRDEAWLQRWLADPQVVKPGTKMPKFDFTPQQLRQAVGYLITMKKDFNTDGILASDKTPLQKGEALFYDYDCLACHRVGSEGRFIGPDLTWVGVRKTEGWEQTWLKDPAAFKPDTFMPNFHIPPEGVRALATFLHVQQGQKNPDSQEWEFRANLFLGNSAPERGELIFKRFACWSCHGESGNGGIRNPNMAPDQVIPALRKVASDFTEKELLVRLKKRVVPEPLDPACPPPPFFCPDYANYMDENEFRDLYAYLQSFAPKKRKWRFN